MNAADDLTAVVLVERIRAAPEQVFDFLVDPEKLVRWMGTEAEIDPTPGGQFRLNVTGGDIAAGTYVEVVRPERVVFSWGWEGSTDVPPGSSIVEFSLTADGDETVVELIHRGLPGGGDDEHRTGWTHFIGQLVVVAAGGQIDPESAPHPS